jgi:two-component sensor histidine kinase
LRRSASDAEQRSLRLVQDRIHGLAMVHQSLYATERLDSVPLNHLLNDICEHLRTSLKPARAQVALEMDLEEITVDTDVATPIALFVTEAMSNVFKHAVGPTGETRIEVRLAREEAGFEVAIMNSLAADPPSEAAEGAPLPLERASGLGSRLMSGFAKQIGGESTLETRGGMYRVTLRAPLRQEPTRFALRNERRERRAREKSQETAESGEE